MQSANKLVGSHVHCARLATWTGNDKWRARFVDKNAIHFVDDDKVKFALNTLTALGCHVIAKVVETKFAVCAVGDVASVGKALFPVRLLHQSYANGKPQKLEYFAHPILVAGGKVLVDGDDVYALAGKRI